jgi:subtilisin family serine protease
VGYLTEPFFQDGVIAQAVNAAAKRGVIYFSSAGNSADAHYELPYTDTIPGSQGAFPLDAHDFGQAQSGPPDIFWNGLVAGAGNFFAVFLQWTDPFGASGNDYDVYIFDQNGLEAGNPSGQFPIGANGTDFQDGTSDPLEVAFIINTAGSPPVGTIKPFFMVVDRYSGDPDKLLEMNFNGFFAVDPLYNVASGSVWGHAASKGALAIGATGAVENLDGTPNPNLDIIEFYSAQGPSRIFFTPAGKPRFESRRKPDFVAVDGVSVTGVNFFTPFFGTSASAPHAAAIAALLKDVDGGLEATGAAKVLRETALERGEQGFDAVWGYGLLDALAATRRAGQVGNSGLYFMCIPGRHPIQVVVPGSLVPHLVGFGLDFGRCRGTT